jgi:hypothetical protein
MNENRLATKNEEVKKLPSDILAYKLFCCGTIICNTRFYCGKRIGAISWEFISEMPKTE